MSKPSIVIIPGAWQKPVAFEGIVRLFQQTGYPTVHVPLPTVGGTETPLAGLDDDVEAVRKVLLPLVDEGKEVVLIGHSAGGISSKISFHSASPTRPPPFFHLITYLPTYVSRSFCVSDWGPERPSEVVSGEFEMVQEIDRGSTATHLITRPSSTSR